MNNPNPGRVTEKSEPENDPLRGRSQVAAVDGEDGPVPRLDDSRDPGGQLRPVLSRASAAHLLHYAGRNSGHFREGYAAERYADGTRSPSNPEDWTVVPPGPCDSLTSGVQAPMRSDARTMPMQRVLT